MDHGTEVLLGLFLIYVGAQIGAEMAQRLKLPAVVGEIVAGCILGPSALGWVSLVEPFVSLAEIGAVFLLFSVGLETRIGDLKRVGRMAILVGVTGVALPFLLGAGWARLSGFDTRKAMFVASAFVATSAGITARVLQEMDVLHRTESKVILGAAVIDDILAMLLLGVVTALQGDQGIHVAGLMLVLFQSIGFVLLIALVGTRIMRCSSSLLEAPVNPHSPLAISVAVCLGLAVVASHLHLAAIIGAFLAGMVAAETEQRHTLGKQMQSVTTLIVPFFFVMTGAKVSLSVLGSLPVLGSVLVVTLLAVAGKLLGCGVASWPLGRKSALVVGMGMVPRGEVGIIVASLGKAAGFFTETTYAIIIAMSLLTSVVAPPALSFLLTGEKGK